MHVSDYVHFTRRPREYWDISKEYLTQINAISAKHLPVTSPCMLQTKLTSFEFRQEHSEWILQPDFWPSAYLQLSVTYLELTLSVPWAKRGRAWAYLDRTMNWAWLTVNLPCAYHELSVGVPWTHFEPTICQAWACLELALIVPWAEHDLPWAYLQRTMS